MQEHQFADPYGMKVSRITPLCTSCSTNFLKRACNPKIPSKRSAKPLRDGLQRDLSRMLITDAAIKGIERKANSKKYNNLWPKAVLEALDEAIRENRWECSLKIFGLLRKQQWYESRHKTYTKLLMMLGKCRQHEQATLLFEMMLWEGVKPTVAVYTALVSAYGQSGLLDKAFSTVEEMKSVSECKPDIYTYSVLINCCTKFQRFDLIKQILTEMSYLGVECNNVMYNTMIDGYGKAKQFELMESMLMDMIESGSCLPDIFTLNSVIQAYGNIGDIMKMEKWYEEFQLMGLKPDIITFNILIRAYGKAGTPCKMSSVMEYMEKRFFSPAVVTYNTVIEVYGSTGHIEKMDEYFKKMKHQGLKPDSITYSSLVSAYSKAGLVSKVDSIWRQAENSNVVLDTTFFNCIMSAYGQAGDLKKIGELFLAMGQRNCRPDYITFATMIQAYKEQGMIEAAQDLERKMLSAKQNLTIF